MEAKNITKAKVLAYLKEKGFSPSQIFGKESERLDPIDRHVILRDMYEDLTGYRMEQDGLTLTNPKDPTFKIVYENMKDFDQIESIEDCVTNLKFLAYAKEASLFHQKEHSRKSDQGKRVDLEQLKDYFQKQHGMSLEELFKDSSYYRYTKKGSDILLSGLEHYTGWKMGKYGLQIQDPDDPHAYLAHPKVQNMSDLKTIDAYLAKINELREDRSMHLQLLQKGKNEAFEIERGDLLKTEVSEFLEKQGWNLSMLFDSKRSMNQRKEKMNAVLRTFAHSYINKENNVVILNPVDKEYQVTESGDLPLTDIKDPDHFMHVLRGFKQNRDLTFFIRSPFVQQGIEVTQRAAEEIAQDKLGFNLESIIKGEDMAEKERTKHLDSLHFYLTESFQDSDLEIVVSHPEDEKRFVSFKDITEKERYYKSIKSIEDFMEKVKKARSYRDLLHQNIERLKQLPKRQQEQITKFLKNDDHER
jgi:hypothetical protein